MTDTNKEDEVILERRRFYDEKNVTDETVVHITVSTDFAEMWLSGNGASCSLSTVYTPAYKKDDNITDMLHEEFVKIDKFIDDLVEYKDALRKML